MPTLLPGEIEVFRAGTFPQGTYTHADIAQMARDYDPLDQHKAFLGVNHRPAGQPEGRAYGYFETLRADGPSLIAKLNEKAPAEVLGAFASGEVTAWSAEIYPDYYGDGSGRKYLKAVKLLGATPPAIKGLKASLDFKDEDHGEVLTFAMTADTCPATCPTCGTHAPVTASATNYNEKEGSTVSDKPKGDEPKTPDPAPAAAPAAVADPKPDPKQEARFAELQAENVRLKAEGEATAKRIAAIETDNLRAVIHSFSEGAVRENKINKGDLEAGLEAFCEAIDGVVVKYGEGDKAKEIGARHWFAEFVNRRLSPVPLTMVGNGTPEGSTGKKIEGADDESIAFAEKVDAYAKEHKVDYRTAHIAMRKAMGNPYVTRSAG
jgi:hypothetical protein